MKDKRSFAAGPLGRVERFFLCLDEVYMPEQRLRAIQVTQQFDERAERLQAHATSLRNAALRGVVVKAIASPRLDQQLLR